MNKILVLVFHLWILCGFWVLVCFGLTISHQDMTIDRFDEVEKHCDLVISSASQLKPVDEYKLNDELVFGYEDLEQEDGDSPLIPFNDTDMPKDNTYFMSPMKLVQFKVFGVDLPVHRYKNTVKMVRADLSLSITRDILLDYWIIRQQQFFSELGLSRLMIAFEGIYVESEQNGGERLLCLMGKTALPSFKGLLDSSENKGYMFSETYRPPLFEDDQILLILCYPQIRTLTSREIHGEMTSLREVSDPKYFDKVRVSSLVSLYSDYQFGYEERLTSEAYPNQDELMDNGVKFSDALDLCRFLRSPTYGFFKIVNNWKCSETDEYCKLGPFVFGSETIGSINGSLDNVRLIKEHVRCEKDNGERNATRVAIVFRAISLFGKWDSTIELQRSSVSSMTLSAEGIWNVSSAGELCMIGCLGRGSGSIRCDSRICLHFPHEFSIKQLSFISGSMSSIVNGTSSYSTLLIEKELHVEDISSMSWYMKSYLSYKYSKIDLTRAFLERSQSSNFKTFMRKSLPGYPALEDGFDRLAKDLSFDVLAVTDPLPSTQPLGTRIKMRILSFGHANDDQWFDSDRKQNSVRSEAESNNNRPLNVSAHLQFTETLYNKLSLLSLEGLYDPLVGEMYLIGCRDVRGSPKNMIECSDLEDGRDCLIEVKIQYPPNIARWLINPTVKISITSQRNIDDPLHFSKISLQTIMISYNYHEQERDIYFRRTFEGILRILIVSAMIAIILKQFSYMRNQVDVSPFVSLTMLLIQADEFFLPLISHAEILFNWKVSECEAEKYYTLGNHHWSEALGTIAKLLLAVAIVLNIWLFRKIRSSRLKISAPLAPTPQKVRNEMHVFVITLVLHVVGFISARIVLGANHSHMYFSGTERLTRIRGREAPNLKGLETEMEKYFHVVHDLFLLPQIIGNFVWQVRGKPLSESYYIGFTILRLLRCAYDNIRDPIYDFHSLEDAARILLRMFSKPGIIFIPMTSIGLAAIVHIQQKWNYEKRKRI